MSPLYYLLNPDLVNLSLLDSQPWVMPQHTPMTSTLVLGHGDHDHGVEVLELGAF